MFDRLSDIARFQPRKSYYVCSSPCTSFAVSWLISDNLIISNLGNSDLGTVVTGSSLQSARSYYYQL